MCKQIETDGGIYHSSIKVIMSLRYSKVRLAFYRSKDDGEHSPFIHEDVVGCTHTHDVFYLYFRTCRHASVYGCIEK